MNPQAPEQQNYQPPATPPVPPATSQPPVVPQAPTPTIVEAPKKSHKKLALLLIIGPTALFILAMVLYAISNFAFSSSQPTDGDLYGDVSPIKTILNIFLFLSSAVSILTWLPGLIIGIVLLAKQSK